MSFKPEYIESDSLLIGPFKLGKFILFQENLDTAMRRHPDNKNSFFAEFIVDDNDELVELINALDTAVEDRWPPEVIEGCDQLDYSPVYQNGRTRMYPTDTYIRAKARPYNPPNLFTFDGELLPMDSPRNEEFYSGVPVYTEVAPLSYQNEDGKKGVSLILNAVAIVSTDREANPLLQFRQRRSADKMREMVLKQIQ